MHRKLICLGILAFTLASNAQIVKPKTQSALNSIQASELKGDLSFLASDLLQGRYTPSPGLDIAAEFIASKFRAIGLEPGGTNQYFQQAEMVDRKMPRVMTPLTARDGDKPLTVGPSRIHVTNAYAAAAIKDAPVLKISERNPDKLKGLTLDGKVILVPTPDYAAIPASERAAIRRQMRAFDKNVAASKALMEVIVVNTPPLAQDSRLLFSEDADLSSPPVVQVESSDLFAALSTAAPLTLSLDVPSPEDHKTVLKNVIGLIRGSDPTLKSTCVLVTAHYDHLGTIETAGHMVLSKAVGVDNIYNGANDDGSGTVSVIEIARALAPLHPRRSIVFIAFFGEERGLLGSSYYASHPLFPLSQTVADLNLEQVGRTDSSGGPEIANASVTGYDYSDVTRYLEAAGKVTGIKIYKDKSASDPYFVRSDNAALAEHGVPAHTLTTAFEFPDYHAVGDEWQKIDYANMAKVDRAVALAVLNIANAQKAPEWNQDNPKTELFREARSHGTSNP